MWLCIMRWIAAVLLVIFASGSGSSACTLEDYRTDERPDPPGVPTVVTASFVVADFLGVDDVNQRLDLDLVGTFSWRDPRLIDLEGCRFNIDEVWFPNAALLNSTQPRITRATARNQVAIGAGGVVTYSTHFSGLISSYHDLREFPFDKHDFEILVGSLKDDIQTLEFAADQQKTWIADRLNIEGWEVRGVTLSSAPMMIRQAGKELSVLSLTISADRSPDYYVYRVMLLLAIVVAMSWVIFWVPPSHFEFQIGLGATSMLTAIAFSLSIAGQLPRLGYLTILDKVVIWAVFLVFLSIVEALVAGLMVIARKEEGALRLDRYSRVAFPVLLFGAWALFVFVR